jgi:hypothetical protein
MIYPINRGIGDTVEFKGLKQKYLFIAAAGVVCIIILTFILLVSGFNYYIIVGLVATFAIGLLFAVFHLNRTYGEHGLMKKFARQKHPKRIANRQLIREILSYKKSI